MKTASAPANGTPADVTLSVAVQYLLAFVLLVLVVALTVVLYLASSWLIDEFPTMSAVVFVGIWIIWLICNPKEALLALARAAARACMRGAVRDASVR